MNLRGGFKRRALSSMPSSAIEEVYKPGPRIPGAEFVADFAALESRVLVGGVEFLHRRIVGRAGHSADPTLRALATPKAKP